MRCAWEDLRNLTYFRPKFWRDVGFVRELWAKAHEGYETLRREEKSLSALISKGSYDRFTEGFITGSLMRIINAWSRVKVCGYSFQDLYFKSLDLTPREVFIYMQYREAAFMIFRTCCEIIFNMQLANGHITQSEWGERTHDIKRQERFLGC